jgi:hypothetical protein
MRRLLLLNSGAGCVSEKKKKNNFLFWQKDRLFFNLSSSNQRFVIEKIVKEISF